MQICILGRQPALGLAELEQVFGASQVHPFGGEFAFVDAELDIHRLGGTVKVAKHLTNLPTANPQKAFDYCRKELPKHLHYLPEGKVKLGASLYGFTMPAAKINANMLSLKKVVKNAGRSVRVVPNTEPELSSAQTYHNALTSPLGMELIFIKNGNETVLGQVQQVQDFEAYAARDQARPKTDAFVGMLPPKLALTMLNLTGGARSTPAAQISEPFLQETKSVEQPDALLPGAKSAPVRNGLLRKTVAEVERTAQMRVLDPFCGTGVVLQEAALLGFDVYGTDLAEKMIRYSKVNLDWLKEKYNLSTNVTLEEADAMTAKWQQPIDAVVAETYLGQPFSAPPSSAKLTEVRGNCNHIIKNFLKNIASQLEPGTPLCLAVPAWRDGKGNITQLPLIHELSKLGFAQQTLHHVSPTDLLYFREDQVVARQLLIVEKT